MLLYTHSITHMFYCVKYIIAVETLSFGEAADFNPQEWFTWLMTFRSARLRGQRQG